MSGHSKWHNIQKKKGVADSKRGQVFSKLAKAISVVAREGGGDPSMNFSLRLAMEKARAVNMPKENIDRAIARGTGEGSEGIQLQTLIYEGMGPGGAAILIQVLTDNPNRALTNIRSTFTHLGGNMGAKVKWMFEQKGVIRVQDASAIKSRDEFELKLIDVGAQEINWSESDAGLEIISAVSDLQKVEAAVRAAGLTMESADLEYLSKDKIKLSTEDEAKLENLLATLDDDDDVANIFTNAE